MGAASNSPLGAAPPPVSTATGPSTAREGAPQPLRAAVAVLTIFDGQAVYRVTASDEARLPLRAMLRFRPGSRTHEPRGTWP